MQYPETLPLADHEVVLTFDDGPLPRNSNKVLEILASQCVKATFFTIGRMAQSSPEGVRKLRDAGHTIGTHTQNHPLSMNRMSIERARQEIDEGIASVKAALGDDADTALAPFFRIPGLLRADDIEEYLAAQGIQIWSADFLADDWRHISSSRVYDLAVKRLEARGKGILLLHDIQARTVAALPRILNEMKARGYRIVQVVPATPERPATPTEPELWRLHPGSESIAVAHWPKPPNFVFADIGTTPIPALSDFNWLATPPLVRAEAPWPGRSAAPTENAAETLPAPARSVFEVPEGLHVALQAAPSARGAEKARSSEHANRTKLASNETRESRHAHRKVRLGHGHGRKQQHAASRAAHHAVAVRRGRLKHLVQVKKRNV